MKIFVVCSTQFYNKIEQVEKILKQNGHTVIYPNGYNDLEFNKKIESLSENDLIKFKA